MNLDLGTPIALGRTAEIYAWQPGWVVKLYFNWFSRENIEYEARIGRALHFAGLSTPAVGEMIEINNRTGLIYERIPGQTIWQALSARPELGPSLARRMAELHTAMHASQLNVDLPSQHTRLENKIQQASALPTELRDRLLASLAQLPSEDRLCHGDFHPENILTGPLGERVIDWIDATRGSPLADLARTSIILLGAAETQPGGPQLRGFLHTFHAAYLRAYFRLNPGGQQSYQRWLPVIAGARLSENIFELEKWLLAQARLIN
jgi:aminoglycoside phosphotransferase (APT) family kinase protein